MGDEWRFVAIVLTLCVVAVGVWSLFRELLLARIRKESEDNGREIMHAMQDIYRSLQSLCEQVTAKHAIARDGQDEIRRNFEGIKQLVLDVERRMQNEIRTSREIMHFRNGGMGTNVNFNGPGNAQVGDGNTQR